MKTWLNLIGVLVLVTAVANSTATEAQQIAQDTNSSSVAVSFEVVHTSSSDSGGIPDSLKKYGKYLRRAGSENWKFHSKNSPKPVPGTPKTVNLPGKLGKATISIDAKGVATVKIMDNSIPDEVIDLHNIGIRIIAMYIILSTIVLQVSNFVINIRCNR